MTVSSRKKHYSENYFSSSTLDEQLISRKFGLFDYSGSIAKIGGILNALADEWNQFVFEDDSSDQWQKIERRENTLQSIFKDFTTDYIAE